MELHKMFWQNSMMLNYIVRKPYFLISATDNQIVTKEQIL